MKNSSNKRSLVADQWHPSSVCCDHRAALREIARGQSLVTQLRAIVLPALQSDERCDLAAQMLEGILDCSRKAISELQLLLSSSDASARDDDDLDDKRRVGKIISSHDDDHCSSKAAEDHNAKPLREGDLVTRCRLKHQCHTTMATNGGNTGRSTSTTPNTQGATTDAHTGRKRSARQQRRCSSEKTCTTPTATMAIIPSCTRWSTTANTPAARALHQLKIMSSSKHHRLAPRAIARVQAAAAICSLRHTPATAASAATSPSPVHHQSSLRTAISFLTCCHQLMN